MPVVLLPSRHFHQPPTTIPLVSRKSGRIAERIAGLDGRAFDPHYLGYFECFNQGLFYEAHDVLEELWLAERGKPDDAFYKGLIQLTGAFVHLRKNRLQPAASLFRLARSYLERYPASGHLGLNVQTVLNLIDTWLARLTSASGKANPLTKGKPPEIHLGLEV